MALLRPHNQPGGSSPGRRLGLSPLTAEAGPRLRSAIAVVALGALIGLAAVVRIAPAFVRTLTSIRALTVPGSTTVSLGAGRYMVFERTGTTTGDGGFNFTHTHPVTLGPGEVSVTGPDGMGIRTGFPASGVETISRGSKAYTGAVVFEAPEPGVYEIRVATTGGEAIVARSIGSSLAGTARWFVLGGIGAVIAAGGVALVVTGEVRRNRQRRPRPPEATTAAY